MQYITNSYEETRLIARKFASELNPGDVVTLDGDLGAGKTAFTSGLVSGLGNKEYVTSPTFTIVNEYRKGNIPVFHFDVYRLESIDDLYDIGFDDYLSQNGICVIEWADIIRDGLDMPYYEVRISKILDKSEDTRSISVIYRGDNK